MLNVLARAGKWIWNKVTERKKPEIPAEEVVNMQKYYIDRIKFERNAHALDVKKMQDEYENQKNIIKEAKKQHPENGKEFEHWGKREDHLLIEMTRKNQMVLDLKEELIFVKFALNSANKKLRAYGENINDIYEP